MVTMPLQHLTYIRYLTLKDVSLRVVDLDKILYNFVNHYIYSATNTDIYLMACIQ